MLQSDGCVEAGLALRFICNPLEKGKIIPDGGVFTVGFAGYNDDNLVDPMGREVGKVDEVACFRGCWARAV